MAESKVKMSELSITKIKSIGKSSDTGNTKLTSEALFIMTRATEMFIQYLAKNVYKISNKGMIQYEHLAKCVKDTKKLEFLLQLIPQKITLKRYKEIMMTKCDDENESTSSEDEEEPTNTSEQNDYKKVAK